jgi:hypothetical protein
MSSLTLSKFLEPFFPDETETVHLRGIYPDKKRAQIVQYETTRARLAGDKQFQNLLVQKNKTHGLYFVVNAGGNTDDEIKRFNAVFCEIDGVPGKFSEQHKVYDECELPPSVRIETYKSVHVYWLIEDCPSAEKWQGVQKTLIKRFDADDKIKNASRVMRLPFFKHVRLDAGKLLYKKVNVHTFASEKRYSWAEIENNFPPVAQPKAPVYAKNFENSGWQVVIEELIGRISSLPSYHVESNRHYATARGVCHDGKGNTALTVDLRDRRVFCQKKCTIDSILSAFGLTRPERKTKIEYVERKKQNSNFYLWFKEQQKAKQNPVEDEAKQ